MEKTYTAHLPTRSAPATAEAIVVEGDHREDTRPDFTTHVVSAADEREARARAWTVRHANERRAARSR